MKLSTLITMSARHPWHTIGVWVVLVLIAVVAIGALLGGALTTEGNPTNNPQSERAHDALSAAFPPTTGTAITDIVVVRSSRYTVDAPQFRSLVRETRLTGTPRRRRRKRPQLGRHARSVARQQGPPRDDGAARC